MEQERVELSIRGENFVVRTNNDEPEVTADELKAVAVRVQEKIDLILAQSGYQFSITKAAVYAAFLCAVEAEKQRETNANLRRQLGAIAQDASGSHQQVEMLKRRGRQ
ncbi:MAG: cell division protein ZapA [Oscillospiraceae bacterium]|jgi:cell division protein ZapA (FtsZ GTPase activity inhibitor)|nr:cell division protein ZapA [Oscillospiraceae bacterium]